MTENFNPSYLDLQALVFSLVLPTYEQEFCLCRYNTLDVGKATGGASPSSLSILNRTSVMVFYSVSSFYNALERVG